MRLAKFKFQFLKFARQSITQIDIEPKKFKFAQKGGSAQFDSQVVAGTLEIDDTARATDTFFGTLLHREVLARIYGVTTAPLRNRKTVAEAVANDFISRYAAPT